MTAATRVRAPETRVRPPGLYRVAFGSAILIIVLIVLLTAPEPPEPGEGWRWATIAVGLAACTWNVSRAAAAFRRSGPVSLVAFLHLWVFFAFSFPAVEITYRYAEISLGFWRTSTNDQVLFQAALLLTAFQVLFFLALGDRVDATLTQVINSGRARRPDRRVALTCGVLLLPLVFARLVVLRELGLSGVATAMVTRTDYFGQLHEAPSPVLYALSAAFPVYAVALGCLAVSFLVPHPSALGRRLFLGVLLACAAGVALSGGRGDLAFVAITVGFFMYMAGYRTVRHVAPLVLLALLLAGLLFMVAQARHGEDNALSRAADGAYVGKDYSRGDVSQVLGLGRFDFVVMILDRHSRPDDLLGSSYLGALLNGLDTTFLPQIAAGVDLPSRNVSGEVLGPWMFGEPRASALPSAPGEAYLNFGYAGVLGAALVLGMLTRGLVGVAGRLQGPPEVALVLVVYTLARLLSDESSLMAFFAVQNWPIIVMTWLVARHTVSRHQVYSRPVTQ